MNNKPLLILTILILQSVSVMAQLRDEDYKTIDTARLLVLYDLTFVEDSTRTDLPRRETMMLLIGKKLSLFKSYNCYRADLMMRQKEKDGLLQEWFESSASKDFAHRFMYEIFKNYPNEELTWTEHLFLTGSFRYNEPMELFRWETHEDTMEIQGYVAQKATCSYGGRQWVAWFTDELPFNDGPYKFNGLPGLILKVADTRNHYCFDFVSVEVPDQGTPIEWQKTNYVDTTKQGFFKAEDELRENILSHFDERTSAADQKQIHGVMKSRNNPIELDRK